MKTKLHSLSIALALLAGIHTVAAQGTAFTYQGQLTTGSGPANGYYDVTFKLWNASSGGTQSGTTQTFSATVISNGLFTVTGIDFGSVYNGTPFWLELAVRTNGVGSYQTVLPRQPLTPTPYAITAENVDGLVPASQLSGTIPTGALSGTYGNGLTLNNAGNTFSGNGAGLTGVNASLLNGHNANFFWQLGGNAGTVAGVNFVGTSDNQPLELHVDGTRALRIEPGVFGSWLIPNMIGGSAGNWVANGTVGNVIAGGADYFEGYTNYINAGNYNTIGGGVVNVITNGAYEATIAGGYDNSAANTGAAIGGGEANVATGAWSTVPGGYGNMAAGDYSFAAGSSATANNTGSFVWSDASGLSTTDSGANQFVVRATGGAFFYDGATGVVIDSSGSNYGTIDFGIKFGTTSGEGIASQRTPGGNQYDLNFYTAFINRMTILNNGNVGIGTITPAVALDVNGLIDTGSHSGTSQAPNEPGLVIRRINSTATAAGSVVARSDTMTLERDGTFGGFRVSYVASPGDITIAVMGITSTGAQVNYFNSLSNPAAGGTIEIFTDGQAVHFAQISFGRPFDEGHLTQVNICRSTGDFYWVGTVNSTYNQ